MSQRVKLGQASQEIVVGVHEKKKENEQEEELFWVKAYD